MTENFPLQTGGHVVISIDEDQDRILVTDPQGAEIGSIEFDQRDDGFNSYIKIIWAYLDKMNGKYLHQGIGTRCIEMLSEFYGEPIGVTPNDGRQREDGSHPTQDAPAFFEKLKRKKLVFECY